LSSIKLYSAATRKELRSFGLILAAGFFVIATLPVVFRHDAPGPLAFYAAIVCALVAVFVPAVLRYVYPMWMMLGTILGWINSRIILTALFYVVVTPVRWMMRIAGNDPMNRKFDLAAQTYRVGRKPRDVSHMRHPF
jgi:hypothetical protein